jgi:2,5-diketo-D-gluconate reductase B
VSSREEIEIMLNTTDNPYFTATRQRGFGTFPLGGEQLMATVATAAEVGYRAFDTAQIYGNEADVGRALAALGMPRGELFVTTKVQHDNMVPERFLASVEQSLVDLQLDRVDVLLLHFPPLEGPIEPGLELLLKAQEQGLADHVGVSNYTPSNMRRARAAVGGGVLVINQVEFHPLLDGGPLLAAAIATGIPLAAFCTVARGEVLKYQLLAEIGLVHGKTAAQIGLRWTLQKGVALTTMSTSAANIRANFDIMDFELSADEMARIDSLNTVNHRIITRAGGVPWAAEW